MKNILIAFFLLITLISNSQVVTIYTEDFSNDWKKGAITYGGITPAQPTDGNWSWVAVGSPDNDGGSASSWDDMGFIDGAAVMSTNGATTSTLAFRWNDVNNGSTANRVDWYSKSITGAYTTITASLSYAIANGSGANSVWAYYQIDGGTWTLFGSSVNQSTASGTFTSGYLSCSSSIKIKVETLTRDANSAYVTIDNVQVTGCAVIVPAVSIASSDADNTICSGTSVTFTATPTNGGAGPSYQWKKNGVNVGTNSTTYTNAALANSDIISCVMTSNASCVSPTTATSNSITNTVNSTSVGGTVAASQNVYSGDNPADIILTGKTGSVVKWESSSDSLFTATSDIAITSTTLASGNMGPIISTTYYRAAVKNGVCNTVYSSFVKMTIVSPLPIQLLYFRGIAGKRENLLEWASASETNNDFYSIYYMNDDNLVWKEVAKVDGVGNSSHTIVYFKHLTYDFKGINYYMLEQTDFDGKRKTYNERIIALDNRDNTTKIVARITNSLGQDIDDSYKGMVFITFTDGSTIIYIR